MTKKIKFKFNRTKRPVDGVFEDGVLTFSISLNSLVDPAKVYKAKKVYFDNKEWTVISDWTSTIEVGGPYFHATLDPVFKEFTITPEERVPAYWASRAGVH